jgi:PmbA protein
MKMADDFDRTIEVVSGLLKGKVDSFELYMSQSRGLVIEAKNGEVDALRVSSDSGVGLRILSGSASDSTGGSPGFAYSNIMTDLALAEMVELAIGGSHGASEDVALGFALPADGEASVLDSIDPDFDSATEQEKIQKAINIESSARDYDKLVARVRKASYSESRSRSRTYNSRGVDTSYEGTFCSGSVMAVAEGDGDSQVGWEMELSHKRSGVDPVVIGRAAAERAVGMLGAKIPGSIKAPAVLENTVVMDLMGQLVSSFTADNVHKGKSMLMDKLGKKVVSDSITIWDDGLMQGGWASSIHDCEGVPTQKTALIAGGVCNAYLYDTYWANRTNAKSTGNAARGGFKGAPAIGTTNLYMEKGDVSLEGLFAEMGKGLFITELMGVHTIDPVSGEFSVGASGLWIEGGKIAYPVRGLAISGSLLELFSQVELIGSDMRFLGSVGAPSILISELHASGS